MRKKFFKTYETWYITYILLLSCSILVTLSSVFFNNKIFSIISNVGCGAVASVITAWIIDYNNRKEFEKNNLLQISYLLQQWDSIVDMNLKYFLRELYQKNLIENGEYSIREIIELVKKSTNEALLTTMYHRINDTIFNINIGVLLSGKQSQTNNKIYMYLKNIMDNFNSFLYINKNYKVEQNDAFIKGSLKFELEQIEKIYNIRNIKMQFEVKKEKEKILVERVK